MLKVASCVFAWARLWFVWLVTGRGCWKLGMCYWFRMLIGFPAAGR